MFLLAVLLCVAPVRVSIPPSENAWQVSARAVAQSIDVRLGEAADDWTVEVVHVMPPRAEVRFVTPENRVLVRGLYIRGDDRQAYTRALAAEASLVIEATSLASTRRSVRSAHDVIAWASVDVPVSVGLQRPATPAFGLGLASGAWLARDRVQPLGEVDWQYGLSASDSFHRLLVGGGVAAGGPVPTTPIWLGGVASLRAAWLHPEDAPARWTSASFVGGMLQARLRHMMIHARFGLEITIPTVYESADLDVRLDPVRLGLRIGLGLPFGEQFQRRIRMARR